ncbi:hypothetical protein Tco_0658815 [Tanacetum coccineum]
MAEYCPSISSPPSGLIRSSLFPPTINKIITHLISHVSNLPQMIRCYLADGVGKAFVVVGVSNWTVHGGENFYFSQKKIDIEVSTEKESVEHVEEVKDVEPVKQEELTPNDENDDTGVSQEDDKDVAVEPEVDEKDDMEAEEESVEDKEADMEKEEVEQ